MAEADSILVLNTGSSSVKFALFDGTLREHLSGVADGIGGTVTTGHLKIGRDKTARPLPDHNAALNAIFAALAARGHAPAGLGAVAHRVVHGGVARTAPCEITAQTQAEIAACVPLAPLHNPHALAAIEAVRAQAPDLAQYASFDTSFHATNPDVATCYALPPEIRQRGIRRYGFHGLSYAALCRRLPEITAQPLPGRLLALHLGNGASICAIRDGRSVATTMGYSPLEGLTMGTRAGGIDANAVLRLAEEDGIAATRQLLNAESGLLGLSGGPHGGLSDMRALEQADSDQSRFARAHFAYWAQRHAGSMIAAMGGVDAMVFTGGIGENDRAIRAEILTGLAWTGVTLDRAANSANKARISTADAQVAAWIVAADEERQIAFDAASLMRNVA